MRKLAALGVAAALLLSGCESLDNNGQPNRALALTGMGLGAALGSWGGFQIGGGIARYGFAALGAGLGYATGKAVVEAMTESDKQAFSKSADEALRQQPDGETVMWRNPETGNLGTVTPTNTYERYGYRCRDLEMMIANQQGLALGDGAVCLADDNTWQPVNTLR